MTISRIVSAALAALDRWNISRNVSAALAALDRGIIRNLSAVESINLEQIPTEGRGAGGGNESLLRISPVVAEWISSYQIAN